MADKDFSNQNRMDAFNISRYQNKIDLLSTNAATLDPDQCGCVQFQTILKQGRISQSKTEWLLTISADMKTRKMCLKQHLPCMRVHYDDVPS